MNKRILLFIVLLCSVGNLLAQRPMFVYKSDGSFQGFLTSQVEQIAVSKIDLDSTRHDNYVVQEIWTPDSVYRFPLAEIDSISFVMPPTEFKPNAVDLSTSLKDYVISADTTHIFLAPNTPKAFVPAVGQKLGYPTIDELFPYGFAGVVKSISNESSQIVIDCTPVPLDEVFDTFYCVVSSIGSPEEETQSRSAHRAPIWEGNIVKIPWTLPAFTQSVSGEVSKYLTKSEEVGLSGGTEISMTEYNSFDITVFYVVNRDMGYNVQASFIGHHDVESKVSLYGKLEFNEDIPYRRLSVKKHFAYGLCMYFEPGAFINASGQMTLSGTSTEHYTSAGCYEFSSIGQSVLKPSFHIKHTGSDNSLEATLDGRIAWGAYMEIGLTYIDQALDEAAFRGEMGDELIGSAVLLSTDVKENTHNTRLYQKLQKSPLTLGTYRALSLTFGAGVLSVNHTLLRQTDPILWRMDLVPTFSKTTFQKNAEVYDANCEIRGNCLVPVQIGYAVYGNGSDEKIAEIWAKDAKRDYENSFPYTFKEMKQTPYVLYPKVKLMGIEMLAEPSVTLSFYLCPDENHPHAIDLGLPSGTKWACCNVGAHAPEEYGGKYAWGETSEKLEYTWENYMYHGAKGSEYIDIGDEISGTEYDVATSKMGNQWCMPTYQQATELYDHCSYKILKNDDKTKAIMRIGQNNNCILLPCSVSGVLYYWTGSYSTKADYNNYGWAVDMREVWIGTAPREVGCPVRPVFVGK